MVRLRYSQLWGLISASTIAVILAIVIPAASVDLSLAYADAPVLIIATGLTLAGIGFHAFSGHASAVRNRLSRSFAGNFYSSKFSFAIGRIRAFLGRLLSPMSGGHRLAGSVSMTSL